MLRWVLSAPGSCIAGYFQLKLSVDGGIKMGKWVQMFDPKQERRWWGVEKHWRTLTIPLSITADPAHKLDRKQQQNWNSKNKWILEFVHRIKFYMHNHYAPMYNKMEGPYKVDLQ